jgi:alpha,alpha-trehalase
VLLRLLRCVNGQVQVRMSCHPVFDYGRRPARWEYAGEGYCEALASAEGAERSLRLTTDLNVGSEGPLATARTLLKEGQTRFVALSWSEHAPPRIFEEADARLTWTAHHWQHWLDRGRFPDHPWRSFLQRSALTLKGLTFAPTGGGRDDVAAGDPRRGAELGLPVHLDPRHLGDAVGLYALGIGWTRPRTA